MRKAITVAVAVLVLVALGALTFAFPAFEIAARNKIRLESDAQAEQKEALVKVAEKAIAQLKAFEADSAEDVAVLEYRLRKATSTTWSDESVAQICEDAIQKIFLRLRWPGGMSEEEAWARVQPLHEDLRYARDIYQPERYGR